MLKRCAWVPQNNPIYQQYHDIEWGVPVYNDRIIFKFIVLESAQAGLSWAIVLAKSVDYSTLYFGFNPKMAAKFTKQDVARLLKNPGIIRNKGKIEASITNARAFLAIQKEFGSFAKYMWGFTNNRIISHKIRTLTEYPKFIPQAVAFAKDLKKRGFRFFGPTIAYAHMQACGMVNDHMIGCFRRKKCKLLKISKT